MAKRTILLHYHLFKNAGTSVDSILKRNFSECWVTREFSGNHSKESIAEWIQSEPDAIAFSSHTMPGPPPIIEGVNIISVIFLRDPVARIISAYQFEHNQTTVNYSTKLAKEHDFRGYVRAHLALQDSRQCRNFHTYRLAALLPGEDPELERAKEAMHLFSLVGLVENFEDAVARLETLLKIYFPFFVANVVQKNVSEKLIDRLDSPTIALLEQNNQADRELLKHRPLGPELPKYFLVGGKNTTSGRNFLRKLLRALSGKRKDSIA